jgi:hypothetical protein
MAIVALVLIQLGKLCFLPNMSWRDSSSVYSPMLMGIFMGQVIGAPVDKCWMFESSSEV